MNRTALERIAYLPLDGVLHLLARLPFGVLYALSDVLGFMLHHLIRYRRRIVDQNVAASFPEKSEAERRHIVRRFYRNCTDIFVETVKLLHISDDEMRRRVTFVGADKIDYYTAQGRSVAVYAAHFGNWEWLTSVTLWARHTDKIRFFQVYRPLRNHWFDRFYYNLRRRFHSCSIPKNSVLRELIAARHDGGCFVTGFISDQKPSHNDGQHHVLFLNQNTPFITGTEMLVRKMNAAVLCFEMHRTGRGHYRVDLLTIADEAKYCKDYEITDTFARLLEQAIRKEPDAWLWSHNRWRRSKR